MAKPRSPVRVETRKLLFGITKRTWVCDDRFESAEFHERQSPGRVAVVHRSTKHTGKWQTSYFDDRGAISDSQRPSCREALADLPPSRWRLRDVKPKR